MDFMKLRAILTLDSSAYEEGLGDAEKTASGFGGKVKSAVSGVAKGMAVVGAAGAAAATALAQIVGGFYPLIYFSSNRLNKGSLHMLRHTRVLWPYIGKALTNGLSEYVSNIALNIVSICYNLQLMRHLGEDGVAAYGIVIYISVIVHNVIVENGYFHTAKV